MSQFMVYVPDQHDEAFKAAVISQFQGTASRIVNPEFEAQVDIDLLLDYYHGAYRQLEPVQALIAAGHTPTDADDLDEDDLEEFASQMHLWEDTGMETRFFAPRPAPWHDYARWTPAPDA